MKTRILIPILIAVVAQAQNTVPLPSAGNVTVPLDEYNKLVELAGQPQKKTDTPPVPHVIKSATMALHVKGDSISGTVLLEGEVFARGVRKVPLVTGMVVLDAQRNGSELALEQEAGTHVALMDGPSEFAVTLDTALPLTIETGRASFNLPVPSAGATRLTLTVPGEQTLVNLSSGLITSRTTQNGHTMVEATLVPGEIANIWWAARLSAPVAPAQPKPVRFLSDVKTLVSVNEGELAVVALADITVMQGEPTQFEIQAPAGYELTGATGPTLISSDVQPASIVLKVSDAALRSHQFLISLAKANTAASAEIPLVSLLNTQRETGEVLVESGGAVELTANERGGLRRMDLKETSPFLRSLASTTLHAAFRYQKRPTETPAVALEWVRFPDGHVLSAVAQQAVVTTLVTSEGRSLTEVKLTLKNQAQPFLKVELPTGATILSADVAGEKVKPVQGTDGSRVPLLRPGFRPTDSYAVSFVFLHAGAPFAKKGSADLALPKMDIPIGRMEWEVFLPQRYKVTGFGGDPIAARLLPASGEDAGEDPRGEVRNPMQVVNLLPGAQYARINGLPADSQAIKIDGQDTTNGLWRAQLAPGQIGGVITDPTGAVVPNGTVTVKLLDTGAIWNTSADSSGRWMVSNVPSGRVQVSAAVQGFKKTNQTFNYDASRGAQFNLKLELGTTTETMIVTGQADLLKPESAEISHGVDSIQKIAIQTSSFSAEYGQAGGGVFNLTMKGGSRVNGLPADSQSNNVTDLQRRVVGVLPIAVNVPRMGSSYRFVRPLVVNEETKLTFGYRSK